MKKIIYIVCLCIAAIFTSCDDFLSVESPDKLTTSSFWRNQADAESGLAAAYSQLEYSIDTWLFAEVKWPVEAYREDVISLGGDAFNYPNWVELADFTYTNGNSQFSMYWSNNYRGINFANQVIEKVPTIPEDKINPKISEQIINEAYFLRAYYHLKLLLNWEKIIVRDKYITEQSQVNVPLSSREDAWTLIINDLKMATGLPQSYNTNDVGRATSGAANAYLGFAYLTCAYENSGKKIEYLGEAVKAFDKVEGYELEKDFSSMFDGTNKNSTESIFELQFTMSTDNGANYRTQLHRWIGVWELGGWDEIVPSDFLFDEFTKEGEIATTGLFDSRLYHTIFYECPYFNDPDEGRVYGYRYDQWFGYEDDDENWITYNRPAFRKLMPATYSALTEDYNANNVPLMRYANVLLMKAEALNELDRTSEAIPLINEVRDIHGDMPPITGATKAEVTAQIEHERIIEFPLENWRWYDLRRWGKLSEAMQAADRTNFDAEKHSFYPVPLTELQANDAL